MSTESFRRHHRRRVDTLISRFFAVVSCPLERAAFGRLLALVRERSDLMEAPPVLDGIWRHRQFEVLCNLAHWHRELGDLDRWPGERGHPLRIVDSLARHALGRYPVPRFLASAWLGLARAPQRWFIDLARGRPVRSLGLPIAFTRRMAHVFLATPDHVEVLPALRRAEVLGLGGTPALAEAVMATVLRGRFDHGDFWRAALIWMVRWQDELDLDQVGPIVDYLDELRRRGLSVRGRTPASLLRDAAVWHATLGRQAARSFAWAPARWRAYRHEQRVDDGRVVGWHIVELLDSAALIAEGRALRHCVASYDYRCQRGHSSIWSLRRRVEDPGEPAREHPVLTIEIDPHRARVVQVRGPCNQPGSAAALAIVRRWADRERLDLMHAR